MCVHPTHRHINCSSFEWCGAAVVIVVAAPPVALVHSCIHFERHGSNRLNTAQQLFPFKHTLTHTHTHPCIHRHARPISTNQPTNQPSNRPTDRQRYVGNGESQSEGLKAALGCRLLPCDAVYEMMLHAITLISHFTHSEWHHIRRKSSKVASQHFNRQSLG